MGLSPVGLGGGGAGTPPAAPGNPPKPPLPCKAAIRSFRLTPRPILSFASDADIPLAAGFLSAFGSTDDRGGEDGGDIGLGFHWTPPAGLGRGGGGAGVGAGPLFSNAAIRSRREPTLRGGGSDIVRDDVQLCYASLLVVVVVVVLNQAWSGAQPYQII